MILKMRNNSPDQVLLLHAFVFAVHYSIQQNSNRWHHSVVIVIEKLQQNAVINLDINDNDTVICFVLTHSIRFLICFYYMQSRGILNMPSMYHT